MTTEQSISTTRADKEVERQLGLWIGERQPAIVAALTTFQPVRPEELVFTVKCKLQSTSRSRENLVIQTQTSRTNLFAAVLKDLCEDPFEEHPKAEGGLFHIQGVLNAKASGKKGAKSKLLRDRLLVYYNNKVGFTRKDFPMPTDLRCGVFERCAALLFSWYSNLVSDAQHGKPTQASIDANDTISKTSVLPIEEVYQYWRSRWSLYHAASRTKLGIGRYAELTLEEAGKRNVRWLRNRLVDEKVARAALNHVEVLLQPSLHKHSAVLNARRAHHPWKKVHHRWDQVPRRQQRARASRLLQLRNDTSGQSITLGSLSKDTLDQLRQELQEHMTYAPQFEQIRDAVELFLTGSPASFPQIARIPSGEEREHMEYVREQSLSAFNTPIHARDDDHVERLVPWESKMRDDLLAIDGRLQVPKLQPLQFAHNMKPSVYSGSAVLQDKRTQQWVLAIEIIGANPPLNDGHLVFANFPGSPFTPPKNKSLLLFPLLYGRDYQDGIFQAALERAEMQHQVAHEQSVITADNADELSSEGGLIDPVNEAQEPEERFSTGSPIGPVEISSAVDEKQHVILYAHIPVHVPVPPCVDIPTAVIGIHLDDEWCHYAIISLVDQPLKDEGMARIGEVIGSGAFRLPPGMDPYQVAHPYNDNYVFNVIAAITKLATHYNAYIGLEDTLWKKREISTSKARNRRVMRFPAGIIATELRRKTLIKGLMPSRDTGNISPINDCGCCGLRLKKGVKRLSRRQITVCPGCQSQTLTKQEGFDRYLCTTCKYTWPKDETWFTCDTCGFRQRARHNTALVTARRTLEQLLEHHARYLVQQARAAERKKGMLDQNSA